MVAVDACVIGERVVGVVVTVGGSVVEVISPLLRHAVARSKKTKRNTDLWTLFTF